MAGKKGGAAPLQVDVGNNDDWETLLSRDGLIVVDTYADWCGPCQGMAGNLKKIKVEIGGDRLILATARADRIEALQRFRARCEPTWLLITRRELLSVLLGADPPRLAREVAKQLRHLAKVTSGEEELGAIPWDELTEEENIRLAQAEARRKRAELLELLRQEAEKRKKKSQDLEPFVTPLIRYTVVVFLPPVVKDGRATKAVEGLRSKWRTLRLRVRQQGKMQISAEMGAELFWQRKLPQHDEVMKCLQSGPSLVMLVEKQMLPKPPPSPPASIKPASTPEPAPTVEVTPAATPVSPAEDTPPPPSPEGDGEPAEGEMAVDAASLPPEEEQEEEVETVVARLLYGFVPVMPPDDIELANVPPTAADIAYGWVGNLPVVKVAPEPVVQVADVEGDADGLEEDIPLLLPAVDSAASSCLIHTEEEDGVVLPGLWTPLTSLSKANAVRVLYPVIAECLCSASSEAIAVVPAPLPPVVVLLFESDVAVAVDAALATLPEDAADDIVKRAWSEASTSPSGEQRLAMAVLADATDTLAALRAVGPIYVSVDADTGAVDLGFYFPENDGKAE